MATVLGVIQVIISVVLIFLVLMHSGKDAGLSGAFGVGSGEGSLGGGSLDVPTGRAGDQPSLALAYSSREGGSCVRSSPGPRTTFPFCRTCPFR